MVEPTSTTKRSYNSSRRARQAAQTRREIVDAAIEAFAVDGWSGATVAGIAERAGVAPETIYKGFGSKKRLVRAAMETSVVGDPEPIPLSDRPEFTALGEGPLEARLEAAASTTASIHERSARLWLALVEAASGDDEVAGWLDELEQGRRTDVARGLELIFGEAPEDQVVTMLWVLFGPETYLKLTGEGFDRSGYEAFLIDAARRLCT